MGNIPVVDSIPVVSQIKSAVEAISGDTDAALRTQEHFANLTPGVSQIKSAVEAISGDEEAARRTQEFFLHGLTGIDVHPPQFHVDANEKAKTAEAIAAVRAAGQESQQVADTILATLSQSMHFEELHIVIELVDKFAVLMASLQNVKQYWQTVLDSVQAWLQQAEQRKDEMGVSYLQFVNIYAGPVAAFYSAFGPSTEAATAYVKDVGVHIDALGTEFTFFEKAIREAEADGRNTLDESGEKRWGKYTTSFQRSAGDLQNSLRELDASAVKMQEALDKV